MAKETKRETILKFVESVGGATFTQIQRFIVDLNYGEGTYDAGAKDKRGWRIVDAKNGKGWRYAPANHWRGYYCSAFCGGCYRTRDANGEWKWSYREGNLVSGKDRLVKEGKLYSVVRD